MENQVILKIKAGSHLYGLNTPNSDEDYIGVYLNTLEELTGLHKSEIIDESVVSKDENNKNTKDAVDCKYYELRKFCQLALNANPSILELLYAPDENIVEINKYGKELIKHRNLFLSQKIKHSFAGYAHSQLNKSTIKTENLKELKEVLDYFESKNIADRDMLYDFYNEYIISGRVLLPITKDKNFPDYVIIGDLKFNNQPIKKVVQKLRERVENATNRANSMLKHGFDSKFVSHTLRLIEEGEELLTTGFVEFPLKNKGYLLDVKQGEIDLKEVIRVSQEKLERLENLPEDKIVVTKKPKVNAVDRLCQSIYQDYIANMGWN